MATKWINKYFWNAVVAAEKYPVTPYAKMNAYKNYGLFSEGNISIDTDEDGNATYSSKDQLIYPKACTSSDFVLSYEIIDDYLYLYYPCIEGCSQKFKKK